MIQGMKSMDQNLQVKSWRLEIEVSHSWTRQYIECQHKLVKVLQQIQWSLIISIEEIVGFQAHKRSEKLVKIKNWSDKIETQTRIHAKTKDLIRRLVTYLKSYTNEEDED